MTDGAGGTGPPGRRRGAGRDNPRAPAQESLFLRRSRHQQRLHRLGTRAATATSSRAPIYSPDFHRRPSIRLRMSRMAG